MNNNNNINLGNCPNITGLREHCLLVFHDNGNPKNRERGCGYSDHPLSEVWAKGGVNAILKEYREHGCFVEKWEIC